MKCPVCGEEITSDKIYRIHVVACKHRKEIKDATSALGKEAEKIVKDYTRKQAVELRESIEELGQYIGDKLVKIAAEAELELKNAIKEVTIDGDNDVSNSEDGTKDKWNR